MASLGRNRNSLVTAERQGLGLGIDCKSDKGCVELRWRLMMGSLGDSDLWGDLFSICLWFVRLSFCVSDLFDCTKRDEADFTSP